FHRKPDRCPCRFLVASTSDNRLGSYLHSACRFPLPLVYPPGRLNNFVIRVAEWARSSSRTARPLLQEPLTTPLRTAGWLRSAYENAPAFRRSKTVQSRGGIQKHCVRPESSSRTYLQFHLELSSFQCGIHPALTIHRDSHSFFATQ